MAILDTLTQDVIAKRFYILPEVLQDALQDAENQRQVEIACLNNAVGDPNELQNAKAVVAAVILGLVHMDDLKFALAEDLLLPPPTAEKIAAELRKNILEQYRDDIQKIYSPINKGVPMPAGTNPPAVPPAPVPMAAPMPAPTKTIAPVVPAPTTTPAMPPAATIKQAAPAPFMIHQESSAEPLAGGSSFKLNISKNVFASAPTRPVSIPRPPRAAELEIGKAPLPPKSPISTSFKTVPTTPTRMVHYTDFKTNMNPGVPAAAMKPAAVGIPPAAPMRPVASVMPPAPAPKTIPGMPAAPTMPPMPKPPAPISAPAPINAAMPKNPPPPINLPTPPKVVNFGPEEVK